jgi:hypothetical protein
VSRCGCYRPAAAAAGLLLLDVRQLFAQRYLDVHVNSVRKNILHAPWGSNQHTETPCIDQAPHALTSRRRCTGGLVSRTRPLPLLSPPGADHRVHTTSRGGGGEPALPPAPATCVCATSAPAGPSAAEQQGRIKGSTVTAGAGGNWSSTGAVKESKTAPVLGQRTGCRSGPAPWTAGPALQQPAPGTGPPLHKARCWQPCACASERRGRGGQPLAQPRQLAGPPLCPRHPTGQPASRRSAAAAHAAVGPGRYLARSSWSCRWCLVQRMYSSVTTSAAICALDGLSRVCDPLPATCHLSAAACRLLPACCYDGHVLAGWPIATLRPR